MKRQKLIPLAQISVVHILESDDPLEELRTYLDRWQGIASIHAGQVALGAAQLMLLDGGPQVGALLDLILDYWDALPDPHGFHTRELLRNAFAVADPARLARLLEHVPVNPGAELANAIEEARVQLHVPAVRAALDEAIRAVRDYHGVVELNPPASIDAIIAAERASAVRLPDDYRALLTLHDGMRLWDEAFLGTLDFATATDLSSRAPMDDDLVPILRAGDDAWLLYDPRRTRYLLRADHRTAAVHGITEFLDRLAQSARDAEKQAELIVDELLALGKLQRSHEARAVAYDHDPDWSAEDDRKLNTDWATICDERERLAPVIARTDAAWIAWTTACKAALERLPDQLEAAVAYYEWPSRIAEAVRILTLRHALPPADQIG